MHATLQRLRQELTHSLKGLDASQTQLRPPLHPQKWSIQQITEHLLLTWSSTELLLAGRLAKGTPTRSRPTPWQHAAQFTVLRLRCLLSGRKAPEPVIPPDTTHPLSGTELIEAIDDHLYRLNLLCAEAGTRFGRETRCASHLVIGPLTPQQWQQFHLVHGRLHIRQIQSIRKANGL